MYTYMDRDTDAQDIQINKMNVVTPNTLYYIQCLWATRNILLLAFGD